MVSEPTLFNSWKGKRKSWLDQLCPEPFRQAALCAIQGLYFQLPIANQGLPPQERLLKRARHYTFLHRTWAAERIYARLISQSENQVIRQDARYFLGRYYKQIGRLDDAMKLFELSLKEEPISGWSPYVQLSMAKAYESRKQPWEALETYQRSGLLKTDAVVAKHVVELQKNH